MDSQTVTIFENGKYKNEIRDTIMTFVCKHKVSIGKVNTVVERVLNNLAGKLLSCLPSQSVISRLIAEGKFVALKQVMSEMLKGGRNCLHSEGTLKWHKHYQGFQMAAPAGKTSSVGMDQVASVSTNGLLEALNNCIEELSSSLSDDSPGEVTVALNVTIKYTISDQGSINPSFNLINNYRT